jgi:hypothetical protein
MTTPITGLLLIFIENIEMSKRMQLQSDQRIGLLVNNQPGSVGGKGSSPEFELTEEDLLAPD